MVEIPNIEEVRKHTQSSAESIIDQHTAKLANAISNGIWQEANGGSHIYSYVIDTNTTPTYKLTAMTRVADLFRQAGYEVNEYFNVDTKIKYEFIW